jgi:hypothetical protein
MAFMSPSLDTGLVVIGRAGSLSEQHALLQDAAYDSLLRSRRAELHAQVARALEGHSPKPAKLEPELLPNL